MLFFLACPRPCSEASKPNSISDQRETLHQHIPSIKYTLEWQIAQTTELAAF